MNEQISKRAEKKSNRRPKDAEAVAVFLFDLLDDIDTADDACKDDNQSFRKLVRKACGERFRVARIDGENLIFNWRAEGDE